MKRLFNIVKSMVKGEKYAKRLETNLNAIQAYVNALPAQDRKHLQPWLDDTKTVVREITALINAVERH